MKDARTFGSKADGWFIAVSAINAGIALFLSWAAATDGYAWTDLPFCGGLIVFGVIFPAWMFSATRYTLRDGELVIRCGPVWTRLPVADITAAVLAHGLAPAPALSNERVRIDYRSKGGVLKTVSVSPRDRDGFISELSSRRRSASRR